MTKSQLWRAARLLKAHARDLHEAGAYRRNCYCAWQWDNAQAKAAHAECLALSKALYAEARGK